MLDAAIAIEDQALFQAETYASVRKPLLEASTLPPACYTSPAFYKREVQTIFMRVWNFIGRADRIPNAGDYFTIEFTGAIASTADRTACNGSLDSGRRDNSNRASQRASGAATDASQDGGHLEKHRNREGACCREGRRGPLAS